MKILTISDSPNLFSGLARVHRHIIDGLLEAGHSVLPCVWFGYDDLTMAKIKEKKIKPPALSYKSTAQGESNGQEIPMLTIPKRKKFEEIKMLHEIIQMAKPDVVLTSSDYWDTWYFKLLKSKADFSFKWVAYLTIEREGIDKDLIPVLKYADALAVPTLFGKKVLEGATEEKVHYIPYGLEPIFTRAFEEKRTSLKKERNCFGKLRFITVGQNTWRKNIPCLLQAIKILVEQKEIEGKEFYIHSNIDGVDAQEASIYDIRLIAEYLGITKYVRFPQNNVSLFAAPSDSVLVDEYNASDICIVPSVCEGYGLILQEAMGCGLPVIASNWSVMPEMIGGNGIGTGERGWLTDTRLDFVPPARPVLIPTPESLAETIRMSAEVFQKHPSSQNAYAEICSKYAKGRTWESTKRDISELVMETSKAPDKLPVENI